MLNVFWMALVFLGASISSSYAVSVAVTYTGQATVFMSSPDGPISFNASATETYSLTDGVFVTTPVGYEVHGFSQGTLTLSGLGTFSAPADYFEVTNVGIVNVYPIGAIPRMYVFNGEGTFQFGTCPSSFFPCGFFHAATTTFSSDISPVPGPIVGAGLPGLLMAIAGLIGWRRSRRAIA